MEATDVQYIVDQMRLIRDQFVIALEDEDENRYNNAVDDLKNLAENL